MCVDICMHVLVYPFRELQIDNRHVNETVHTAWFMKRQEADTFCGSKPANVTSSEFFINFIRVSNFLMHYIILSLCVLRQKGDIHDKHVYNILGRTSEIFNLYLFRWNRWTENELKNSYNIKMLVEFSSILTRLATSQTCCSLHSRTRLLFTIRLSLFLMLRQWWSRLWNQSHL